MMRKVACIAAVVACFLVVRAAHATTYYVDYTSGADTNSGTSKAAPWKHAPGMLGLTVSNTSTGDGCTGNCVSTTINPGDSIILKGGTVWPYTVLPWQWTRSGSGSTTTFGCTGSGCVYIGYDPTWNQGKVNSVTLTRDLGGCNPSSAPTVAFSGGGGSGAVATALVMPAAATGDGTTNVSGFIYHVTVTNQGSGYSSNPSVTISGGGCSFVGAVADIYRPIIDAGGSWNSSTLTASGPVWPVGTGSGALEFDPTLQINASNLIIDHLEVRNVLEANTTTGVNSGMINVSGDYVTVENSYVHGRYLNSVASGDVTNENGQANAAVSINNGTDEIEYNTFENGDSFYLGTNATGCGVNYPCEFSESAVHFVPGALGSGEVQHNKIYSDRWQIHGGLNASATLPLLIHDNEMWLTLYDVGSAHINQMYIEAEQGTIYEYNNIDHNNVNGASNQDQMSNGTTHYIFNNVEWTMGGGSPNWGIDAVTGAGPGGGHYYFYNNTLLWLSSGTGQCMNSGGSSSYTADLFVVLQNNQCFTSASPFWGANTSGSTWSNQAGSSVVGSVTAANVVDTLPQAATEGYAQSNLYAPTGSSNDTVTFAAGSNSGNLTSLCSGYLMPLCSDINGNPRPASGGWQAGAYQYAGGSTTQLSPTPPSGLSATVD